MVALAAAAKFTPIVLAPLFATASVDGVRWWRRALLSSAAMVGGDRGGVRPVDPRRRPA